MDPLGSVVTGATVVAANNATRVGSRTTGGVYNGRKTTFFFTNFERTKESDLRFRGLVTHPTAHLVLRRPGCHRV